jgi:ABC-type multidrug transport system fused ATPase/permease subunit
MSSWQFVALTDYYGKKYGTAPQSYLKRTYEKWKSGETGMSGQTGTRVLECVPRFLGKEEQFQMLQFYIPSILSKWKAYTKTRTQNIEELHTTFFNIAKLIKENDYTLDWFVKNVFSQEEIDEFMGVLRFTMLDTLNRSYNSMREDISFFYSNLIGKLSQIDASIALKYSVNLLACTVELTTTEPVLKDDLILDIEPPDMVTKFTREYRKILLNYSMDCIKHDAHESGRRHLGLYDLNSLLNSVKNVQDHNEYNARLVIEGSAGSFFIDIEKKSQLRFALMIFKKAVALASIVLALALACIFLGDMAIPLCVILGYVIVFTLVSLIGSIRDLCMEMKEYERRKTKRVAES